MLGQLVDRSNNPSVHNNVIGLNVRFEDTKGQMLYYMLDVHFET